MDTFKVSTTLPKIIMQTWKTTDVPDKWKTSPLAIKKFMPDYQYVLLSDEMGRNFVNKHFPDFLPYFDAFPYNIQRADAIRYMWLYVNGGIYIDLDMEILGSLEYLFTEGEIFFVLSANVNRLTNSILASKPRHPLWLEMIEKMKQPLPWFAIGKHMQVMYSAGPGMLDEVVKSSDYEYVILPRSLLIPYDASGNYINHQPKNILIKQLEGQSWVSWDSKIIKHTYNYIWFITAIIIFFIFLFLVVGIFLLLRYAGYAYRR